MIRRNSYLGLREVEQSLMMTEACGATNCTMMEVGEAISSIGIVAQLHIGIATMSAQYKTY